ncbi:hypothetical protein R69608_07756 [Paraburkholderia nemoris]|nr:hypothetical protein R69608_07756 [Paraburkholderia nemoris]
MKKVGLTHNMRIALRSLSGIGLSSRFLQRTIRYVCLLFPDTQ